jgi:hypothetical protein
MDLLGVQDCDSAVRVMTNRRAVEMERYGPVCQQENSRSSSGNVVPSFVPEGSTQTALTVCSERIPM